LDGVQGFLRSSAGDDGSFVEAAAAAVAGVAAATPGLEHLLVLGKVKELERSRSADLIVVDAPPAGHAAPFLRSATGLSDVVQSGPIRDQAQEVSEMLRDPDRCQAMLVTLPEVTPVTELLELATELGDELGIGLLPTVVNACWPDRPGLMKSTAVAAKAQGVKLSAPDRRILEASTAFGRARLERQREQVGRLRAALDTAILQLPRLPTPSFGKQELSILADALSAAS
jgi:anion-transporting  ArsA/GET3 family ATPase